MKMIRAVAAIFILLAAVASSASVDQGSSSRQLVVRQSVTAAAARSTEEVEQETAFKRSLAAQGTEAYLNFIVFIKTGTQQFIKCVDNRGGRSGDVLEQQMCSHIHQQRFRLFRTGNLQFKIEDTDSRGNPNGRCWEVRGHSSQTGADIISWPCSSARTQVFTFVEETRDDQAIFSLHTFAGLCVEVRDGSTANGARLVQASCFTGAAPLRQRFEFVENLDVANPPPTRNPPPARRPPPPPGSPAPQVVEWRYSSQPYNTVNVQCGGAVRFQWGVDQTHSVVQIASQSCSADSLAVLAPQSPGGSVTLTFQRVSARYFIKCDVGQHCSRGFMLIQLVVTC